MSKDSEHLPKQPVPPTPSEPPRVHYFPGVFALALVAAISLFIGFAVATSDEPVHPPLFSTGQIVKSRLTLEDGMVTEVVGKNKGDMTVYKVRFGKPDDMSRSYAADEREVKQFEIMDKDDVVNLVTMLRAFVDVKDRLRSMESKLNNIGVDVEVWKTFDRSDTIEMKKFVQKIEDAVGKMNKENLYRDNELILVPNNATKYYRLDEMEAKPSPTPVPTERWFQFTSPAGTGTTTIDTNTAQPVYIKTN